MVRKLDDPQLIHFHIHWSRKERLDWESFDSRHEATVRALEVASPGEIFTIEECTETCTLCGPRAKSPN
jgi:hypothetical protein